MGATATAPRRATATCLQPHLLRSTCLRRTMDTSTIHRRTTTTCHRLTTTICLLLLNMDRQLAILPMDHHLLRFTSQLRSFPTIRTTPFWKSLSPRSICIRLERFCSSCWYSRKSSSSSAWFSCSWFCRSWKTFSRMIWCLDLVRAMAWKANL